jgi:hypothetical protein
MLFAYICLLAAAVTSVAAVARPMYEPPALVPRQACAGMNINCTCRCTCGEGVSLLYRAVRCETDSALSLFAAAIEPASRAKRPHIFGMVLHGESQCSWRVQIYALADFWDISSGF